MKQIIGQYHFEYETWGNHITFRAIANRAGQVIAAASYTVLGNNIEAYQNAHAYVYAWAMSWAYSHWEEVVEESEG